MRYSGERIAGILAAGNEARKRAEEVFAPTTGDGAAAQTPASAFMKQGMNRGDFAEKTNNPEATDYLTDFMARLTGFEERGLIEDEPKREEKA